MRRPHLGILGGLATSVAVVDAEEGVLQVLLVLRLLAAKNRPIHVNNAINSTIPSERGE